MGESYKTTKLKTWVLSLASLVLYLLPNLAYASSGITFHGRILRPAPPDGDGLPVTSATTQFKIEIRTPGTENCLLWQEQQTKNLSATNGTFSVTINDTNEPSRIPQYVPFPLERVFSNRTAFTGLTCSIGTSYTPSSSAAGRVLQVSFREDPAASWELIPTVNVNFVPLALNSVQLEGYSASEFLKIDSASTYTPLTSAQVDTLMDVITGATTQYLKPATTFSGDVTGTYNATVVEKIRGTNVASTAPTLNQVLKFNGTSWAPAADDTGTAASDASYSAKGLVQIDTNLATSGLSISSGVLSLPNTITAAGPIGGAGTVPVITFDAKGRLTTVTSATVNDTTKLPLAGGTMTGSINMGTGNITNATSIAATNVSTRNVVLNDNDTNTITISSPTDISANYVLKLPVDDGTSNQVLATDGSGDLFWTSPNNNLGLTANKAVIANGTGTALSSFTCTIGQVFSFDGSGNPTCANVTASGGFLNGGNSYGAAATLGTNDNYALNFETNNTTRMSILNDGKVGIGVTPSSALHVAGISATSDFIALFAQNGITPESSAIVPNSGKMISVQGSGAAYFMARDVTNDIEYVMGSSAANSAFVGTMTYHNFELRTENSTKMTIQNNTGNVGIATGSPNAKLDVLGDFVLRGIAAPGLSAAGQGRIYFDSTANKFKISENNGAYVDLVGSSATVSGTTGRIPKFTSATAIGNSIMSESSGSLSIAGDVYISGFKNLNLDSGQWVNVGSGWMRGNTSPDYVQLGVANGGNTAAIHINASSQVGVGLTSPTSKLDISGDVNLRGIAAPAVSAAGQGRIYFDSTSNTFKVSQNGGAYAELVTTATAATGDITDVVAGAGLTGGATSGSATLDVGAGTGIVVNANDIAVDVGTAAGKIVQVQTGGKLPALDGSDLTNLDAGDFVSGILAVARGGTGQSSYTDGQLLIGNSTGNTLTKATLTQGSGITITNGSGSITIASTLGTSVDMASEVTGTLPLANGGTGATSFTANRLVAANSGATALQSFACATNEILSFNASGNPTCITNGATNAFVNGGNSFGAAATIGTNDTNTLNLETDNTARITILSGGDVGVGTPSARAKLDVSGTIVSKAAVSNATTTIDASAGNMQYTTSDCGNFRFNNMVDGGTYMFVVKGTNPATCNFTAYNPSNVALTVHMPPDNGATTSGKHTIFNLAVIGGDVYVAWTPGY